MTPPLLQLKDLEIGYPGRPLASPLRFEIPAGVRLGIIGGNGTGKTTLVRTLLGLNPPLQGAYAWQSGTTLGDVHQEHQVDLLFRMTVEDLLKMGVLQDLPRLGKLSETFQKRIDQVLDLFEMRSMRRKLFRNLSGGQRQRALIARALISRPEVLVMDEPHNSLDSSFRGKLWQILEALTREESFSWMVIDRCLNRIIHHINWVCLVGQQRVFLGPLPEILKGTVL